MKNIAISAAMLLAASITALSQTIAADNVGKAPIPAAGSMKGGLRAPAAQAADTAKQSMSELKPIKRKSVKKAFFLSLAVPGAGEYYVGQKKYTRGFLAAEAVIWSLALFSRCQGAMWKDDYIAFAAAEAGANPSRKDDLYYQNIYEWPNSDWYNEYQWAEARDLYPDDPDAQAAYVADKLYSGADAWEWQSAEEWDRFRNLRVKSESAYRRVTYAAGTALLNHMLSAVNAARLAKSHNNRLAKRKRITMDFNLLPTWDRGLAFTVTGSF
jgi:hypothetical protein